ncbi:MAG: zf-HC2 domain-containing protein [Elusimicrobiaceae bacterium]|nr:zf-HC2 domain-containing protein [Elusimicrobiaceae bacterium]
MKPCNDVLLYAQGALPEGQKVAFEAHLKTCRACQAELAFLAKLDESLTAPAAPQRVVDELFARTTRKKSVWARFKVAWTAAAFSAVCVGIFAFNLFAPRAAFNASELVAYMNTGVENEYSIFASELTDMEDYF